MGIDADSVNEMVERVARAIDDAQLGEHKGTHQPFDELPDYERRQLRRMARAAIEALRGDVPPAVMARLVETYPVLRGGADIMAELWHAMVDESLKNPSGEPAT